MWDRDGVGPRWSWYLEPYTGEPYGCSAGELVRKRHSWPIFMPGQSLIGKVATLDSSSVTWPEKPGSIQPAVEWVSRPSLPSELLPSSLPATSSGSEMTSYVDPSTNSPGCRTNGSSPSGSTSLVRSGCSTAGSMCGYLWFSKTRKYRSIRTSMLDGWTISGRNGSSLTRPDCTSALMSRSESSTLATYRFRREAGSLSALCLCARGHRASSGTMSGQVGLLGRCPGPGQEFRPLAGVVQWQNVSFPS